MIVRSSSRHRELRRSRRAFTLVELLVVIAIIVTLASMSLVAMSGMMADAKAARTKSIITRIDSLLMAKWEQYRSRPVPVRVTISPVIPAGSTQAEIDAAKTLAKANAQTAHLSRLAAIRLLQRMEFPDRKTDVYLTATPTGLQAAYQRRIDNIKNTSDDPASWLWTPQHQGAECLYLILAEMNEGGKNALQFFKESEIGDVDGDGMNEILDGWGQPIEFIRWAPGVSIQPGADGRWGNASSDDDGDTIVDELDEFDPVNTDDLYGSNLSDIQYGSPITSPDGREGSPDPYDPFQVGGTANFALFPFVYSAGRDKEYDLIADFDTSTTIWTPLGPDSNDALTSRLDYSNVAISNDPYFKTSVSQQLGGFLTGDAYEDTIHNHQLAP